MWIKSLFLDDFGCFNRAHITDLSPQLNVIGGPQRAGKTTLLYALRSLGYGISRSDDIPSATTQYDLGAIVSNSSSKYRIDLTGFGTPRVHAVDEAPSIALRELYGNLPRVQYQQLFTISLDELQLRPAMIESDEELLEVLIGGGFGDVIKLPAYREEFATTAKNIAGKHGRAVYELKSPAERIQKGISAVDEANQHVTQYDLVVDEISHIDEHLSELEDERERKDRVGEQLQRIASQFPKIRQLETHQQHLSTVDREAVISFPLHISGSVSASFDQWSKAHREVTELQTTVSNEIDRGPIDYIESLLHQRDQIERLSESISGIRERHDRYIRNKQRVTERERNLVNSIRTIWPDDLDGTDRLQSINCDRITRERIRSTVQTYTQVRREVESVNERIKSSRDHLEALDSEIQDISESAKSNRFRSIVVLGSASVISGAIGYLGVTLIQPLIGIIMAISVLAVVGMLIIRGFEGSPEQRALQSLEADRRSEQASLARFRSERDRLRSNVLTARDKYEVLCENLQLPRDSPTQAVISTFEEIRDLKQEYRQLSQQQDDLHSLESKLYSDISAIKSILIDLDDYGDQEEVSLDNLETYLNMVERINHDLERAIALREAENRAEDRKNELITLLSQWDDIDPDTDHATLRMAVNTYLDRVDEVRDTLVHIDESDRLTATLNTVFDRRVLQEVAGELNIGLSAGDTVSVLQEIVTHFGDEAAIRASGNRIERDLLELDEKIESARTDRAELKHQLSRLRSSDDIYDAHTTINQAREEFVTLGESYAVNRFAAFFLEKLYDHYIDKTTGPLLREAGDIFARITDDAYCGIRSETMDGTVRFEVDRPDDPPQRVGELSRATIEQLFLSIRIARINRLDCSLPVILDDTFVNFDPAHRQRAVAVINELTATNQVFLLTCHPGIVDLAVNHSGNATYWTLELGRFTRVSDPETIKSSLGTA